MKKPEEYLIPRVLKNWGTDLESIKESIKQAQIDAYNEAIKDAAEECPDQILVWEDDCDYSRGVTRDDNYWKQSILKLKK